MMCDCNECGGVRNCGCGTNANSGATCSGGACSITSQSTAMQRSGTTIHRSAARAFRGTNISGYDTPQMRVGPRAVPPQNPSIAAMGGGVVGPDQPYPKYAPTGLALVQAAGQTPPAPYTNVPPPPQQPSIPGKGDGSQPQPQQMVGVTPEVAQGLMNMGTVGLQGLQAIITTAMTQAGETDRARIAAETARQIGQLQRQGLLTQQEANDAALALQNARRDLPPPPPPPQRGWWESLSTPAKVGVGVGAAVGVVGIGALIYKATR